jgi:enamine deaminase RidA (YjgF/YER057c/UK114 family)
MFQRSHLSYLQACSRIYKRSTPHADRQTAFRAQLWGSVSPLWSAGPASRITPQQEEERAMAVRPPAFRSSPSNPSLGEIQTVPERIKDMPYAPAIRVEAPGDLLFISGATPSPLYHKHPHELSEHKHPIGIADQTRLAMDNIKTILDHEGLTWTDVVKVTKYLTDMRDMDGMVAVLAEYFGVWTPASTTVCVNQLSTPGARVELDMIAVYPKSR